MHAPPHQSVSQAPQNGHQADAHAARAPLTELHHELSEKEVNEIWNVYDRGRDGVLSREEVREMLEDISFVKKGHRNVPQENLEEARQHTFWKVLYIGTLTSKYTRAR